MRTALMMSAAALLALASAATATSITAKTDGPSAGSYTLTVDVSSDFALKPLGTTPNGAHEGHVHYLVQPAGETSFKDACSAGRADCKAATDYATPNTSFTYTNLKEGDVVMARLVNNDHSNLNPDVTTAKQTVSGGKSSPGVGPLLAIALVGLAAIAARRRD